RPGLPRRRRVLVRRGRAARRRAPGQPRRARRRRPGRERVRQLRRRPRVRRVGPRRPGRARHRRAAVHRRRTHAPHARRRHPPRRAHHRDVRVAPRAGAEDAARAPRRAVRVRRVLERLVRPLGRAPPRARPARRRARRRAPPRPRRLREPLHGAWRHELRPHRGCQPRRRRPPADRHELRLRRPGRRGRHPDGQVPRAARRVRPPPLAAPARGRARRALDAARAASRPPAPHLPADALDGGWTQPAPRPAPRRLTPATSRPALPVLRTLGTVRTAPGPLTFEELGQDAGLVLYRAHPVLPPGESTVSVIGLHDRATVYVDGELVGTLERRTAEQGVRVRGDGREVVLELLVENLGRVNYGPRLGEHKGILGDVLVDRRIVHTWESRSLPLDLLAVGDLRGAGPDGDPGTAEGDGSGTAGGGASGTGLPSAPDVRLGSGDVAARGSGAAADTVATFVLDVDEPADTFVALPRWTKGFVWVNDVRLGRYWGRGPQRTLHVPAPLLRAGENTLTVLEQHAPGAHVELRDAPDLGEREEYVEVL